MFLTHDIRLVDCPGLVMPNHVPMEMQVSWNKLGYWQNIQDEQVLSSILPISRIAAVPACINYIAKLLPLERILKLNPSVLSGETQEHKRTWREGMQPPKPKPVQWTSMDILIAYANLKGWVTAKTGRPDIHRAGNAGE
jgi:ribosome biogenesis GTPase A